MCRNLVTISFVVLNRTRLLSFHPIVGAEPPHLPGAWLPLSPCVVVATPRGCRPLAFVRTNRTLAIQADIRFGSDPAGA